MELQEAANIHQGMLGDGGTQNDMNAIVKTWRNRLPVIADDMSHWSDIFTWRQHHYQYIASHYEQKNEAVNVGANTASQVAGNKRTGMLGVHASAEVKLLLNSNFCNMCYFESLNFLNNYE